MQRKPSAEAQTKAIQRTFDQALRQHQAGYLDEAETLYRQVLAIASGHADSRHLLGVIASQRGDYQSAVRQIGEALATDATVAAYHYNSANALSELGQTEAAVSAYRTALQLQPDYIEARYNLANALSQLRQFAQAEAEYRAVLATRPSHTKAHNNLGNVLRQQGQLDAAVDCYRRALAAQPDFAEAHNNLGAVLRDLGRLDEAVACYRRALDLRPGVAEAENELGNMLLGQGRPDEAIAFYRRAIAAAPAYAQAHNNLGAALAEAGDLDAAVLSYHQALEIQPDFAKAHYNLGIARREQRQLDEATGCFRRAITLQPAYAEACNNLGVVLLEQGDLDAAIEQLRRSLDLQPGVAEAHHNFACALNQAGPTDEALAAYRRAAALQPNLGERHYNLAVALLTRGELAEGWRAHEWRWHTAQMEGARRCFAQPQWRGEPAAGRRLLIHAEQGFGDTLQFCRYAPLAAAQGFEVIVEVPPPLVRLVSTLPDVARVIAAGAPLPAFDLHCPMLSLPLAFGTTLADVPASAAYLHANAAQAAQWQARLDTAYHQAPRIGLVWAGNPRPDMPAMASVDRRRSIPLASLAPLLALPECRFFSLQKQPAAPPDAPLIDFMAEMADFADTAALISQLDLVISVDTAAAHLAAALGKPVWLLDRFDACWRWLRGRRDSPWYPSLRIYRQQKPGGWDGVVADIVRDLRAELQEPETGKLFATSARHHRAGRLAEAEAGYRQVLATNPLHADALHQLGRLAARAGRADEAAMLISTAVTINDQDDACAESLAEAFLALGRRQEAVSCLRRAAALRPNDAALYRRLAGLFGELGRYSHAEGAARTALALLPNDAPLHNELANLVAAQGRHAEAVACYRSALALRGEFAEAQNNLGNSLRALGQLPEALECYRTALAQQADYPEAWHNQSIALRESARPDEALASSARAIALRPSFAEAHHNHGIVLFERGELAAAIESYRQAIALRPDQPAARHSLGMALLACGEFAEGWRELEWRWQTPQMAPARREFSQPQWRGEPAEGRTLLIHAEQGFGDTLQFCRYVARAVAQGWRVHLEVPAPLVRLLRGLPGITSVLATGDALPVFDRHCPMMSLPLAFGTTLQTIPAARFYLRADPGLRAAWRARLGSGGRHVGLVWAGNPRPDMPVAAAVDRRRSMRWDQVAPLLSLTGITFCSLQKDATAPADSGLVDVMGEMADFADTAALIEHLDLVIAVDTAVAHLAAAMGKPVWLLDRFDACWRWLRGRTDSPWYPSLRIFRQPAPGAWEVVVAEVREALAAWRDRPSAAQCAEAAVAHHTAGRLQDAASLYRQALAADPMHADSLHLLGVIADQNGRHEEAVGLIDQAITINPAEAVYHYNRGIALSGLGRSQDAIASYQQAVHVNTNYAEAHANLGLALQGLGRLDEAIACARRAIALRPENPSAYNNLGIALREQGALDAAVESYREALARNPDYAAALNNLGIGLKDQGHLDDAIASCRRAVALDPNAGELHYNLATSLLTAGLFAEGWQEFEWRWQTATMLGVRPSFAQPQWDGRPGNGERLLIHAEQGYGDTLQFCRYVPLAAARGWRVRLVVPPPLVRLLRTLDGVDEVIATGEVAGDFAAHCPILSLPLAFGTELATIPASQPYLHADPEQVATWRARLADLGDATRVGVVWAGNPRLMLPAAAAVNRRRSIPVDALAPLFEHGGVQLFSLQKDQPAPAPLHDLMGEMTDFADTAALIANLDLVISVDTAVAHLAGALGKPVWLLDRADSCWRWLRGRTDSPWYPGLRIYRQPRAGDWASVVAQIGADLVAEWHAQPGQVSAESLYFEGIAAGRAGRLDLAIDCYRRALHRRPDFAEALTNLGAALGQQGQADDAVVAHRQSLAVQQDFPEAHSNLGAALWDLGQVDAAIESYQRAIALRPDFADAINNLGAACSEQERLDEARACYERALDLRPDFVAALNNLGMLERQSLRLDAAIDCHRRAVALAPTDAESHTYLALALLAAGDLAAAWPEYEWRWQTTRQMRPALRNFPQPQWYGEATKTRPRLLIHAEQGFGDTLQFARYARLAASRGLVVIVEAPAPLVRLLRSLEGVDQVIAAGEALPPFDLHCPTMSLPLAFQTTVPTIPAWPRYLRADPATLELWRGRVDALSSGETRIGLVWAGNPRTHLPRLSAIDRRRSMPVASLAPLLSLAGIQFFNLQKHQTPPAEFALVDLMPQAEDFADTAALIAQLDLVISVDTAVAHVAAAIGKPVWLLDRFDACWRWMPGLLSRDVPPQVALETPWYPTMRIYRQPCAGDWSAVVAAVMRDLKAADFSPTHSATPEALFGRGVAYAKRGQVEAAAGCYERALALQADFPEALHNLGTLRMDHGQAEAAIDCYRRALAIQPDFAQAHSNLGAALLASGQPEDAIAALQRAIALKPDYADAHYNLGAAQRVQGDLPAAVKNFRAALERRPAFAQAHHALAGTLAALDRVDEAIETYRAGLRDTPDDAYALCGLGVLLSRQKQFDQAIDCYRRAIAVAPDFAEAHYNLGTAYRQRVPADLDAATACYRAALAAREDFPAAHTDLGTALWERGELAEAMACHRRALALKPDLTNAYNNLGATLIEQGELDEAVSCYRRALELQPEFAEVYNNLGLVLRQQRHLAEGIASYHRSLELAPDDAETHVNLAMALLADGRLEEGWQEYEWRWRKPQTLLRHSRRYAQPQWRGEAAAGRVLLIHPEQGYGDTLQFCRYAPMATARGMRVILEVQQPLARLIRSLRGVDKVIARGEALPAFDLYCPIMSLPAAFGTGLASIPASPAYLFADPAQVAAWRYRLAALGPPSMRIGLAWAGNPRINSPRATAVDRRRSMPPAHFAPLFDLPGLRFFSLQKEFGARTDLPIADFMSEMTDFADTAALIANLDLVIAVDTAVVHLAAALGKPVWLLDRFDACWRWLHGRTDSPWYPGLRIFRQPAPGDWPSVISDVVTALKQTRPGARSTQKTKAARSWGGLLKKRRSAEAVATASS
jgi:tetratricopeptide (TPR) repeat protein